MSGITGISGIQSSNALSEYYSVRARTGTRSEETQNRNTGPDTVFFSDAARALAGQSAGNAQEGEGADLLLSEEATAQMAEASGKVSLKEKGMSLFAMMLESLFLADIEESEQAGREAAETGMPEKKGTPLEDSGKAAEIKKVMSDVGKGKADLSDIASAMAVKSSGGTQQADSPAARKADKGSEAKEKV